MIVNSINAKPFLAALLVVVVSYFGYGQCNIGIDAGPDIYVCSPPTPQVLQGSINVFPYVSVQWTPASLLTGASSLNPLAIVSSTTTFTLTGSALDKSNNLIYNGDFESGSSGFSSSYTPSPSNLFPEGTYAVLPDPSSVHPNFSPCVDHTSGNGNMLAVNGDNTQGISVWCQSVAVTPDTDYDFSAWLASIHPASPAQLQFSINGDLLGGIATASPATCVWTPFNATWNSGSSSSATICIVNQNLAINGNDFALDDISFFAVCEQVDSMTVHVVDVQASALPQAILPCSGAEIQLDASMSSSGNHITYHWTTPNGIIVRGANTLTPTVNEPGQYILELTYNDGNVECIKTAVVTVIENPTNLVNIVPSGALSCATGAIDLTAVSASSGNLTYQWAASMGGNIVTGSQAQTASINAPGNYEVILTNTDNGCTSEAMWTVTGQTVPVAVASADTITCNAPIIQINGSGSSTGSNYSYEWTTTNGNIVSGSQSLQPSVNSAGDYLLVVTDMSSGCVDSTLINVPMNNSVPVATIPMASSINCNNPLLQINATSSIPNPTISWQANSGGNIITPTNQLSIQVDQGGTYILTITNPNNGCTNTDTVNVQAFLNQPQVQVSMPDTLTCQQAQVALAGNINGTADHLLYTWSGNGQSQSSTTLDTFWTNNAGSYTLLVQDTLSFCEASTSVSVALNNQTPMVNIPQPDTLDCVRKSVMLIPTINGSGNYTYFWTSSSAQINNPTTEQQDVTSPGAYTIIVTNQDNGCLDSTTVTVIEDNQIPSASILPPDTINCQQNTVLLNGNASSQGQGFTFEWQTNDGQFLNGQNTLEPTVNMAGTYRLIVSENSGACADTSLVTVTAFLDTVDAQIQHLGDTLTCIQQSTDLLAVSSNPNVSYSWSGTAAYQSNSTNHQSITVNNAGYYAIEIRDTISGCTDTTSIAIIDLSDPVEIAIPSVSSLTCSNDSILLEGQLLTAQSQAVYEWSTTDGTIIGDNSQSTIITNSGGTYYLEVNDPIGGCRDRDSVVILVDTISPTFVLSTPPILTCDVKQVTFGASPTNNDIYQYQWSTALGHIIGDTAVASITVNTPGSYQVIATNDQNGCSQTSVVTVTQAADIPNASVLPPDVINCTQDTVVLDATSSTSGVGITFEWLTTNGNFVGGTQTLQPQVNQAGEYRLIVNDQNNNCADTVSIQVDENTIIPSFSLTNPALLTCAFPTDTIMVIGVDSSVYNLSWQTSSGYIFTDPSTTEFYTSVPGTYQLEVLDSSNGCTHQQTITINQDVETPIVQAGMDDTLTCVQNFINLSGSVQANTTNVTYEWTTLAGNFLSGMNTLTPSVDAEGRYILTVTNNDNGCQAIDSVLIAADVNKPMVSAGIDTQLTCQQVEIQLTPTIDSGTGISFEWITTNGDLNGQELVETPIINTAGTYRITVYDDASGCESTDEVIITENKTAPTVSLAIEEALNCVTQEVGIDVTLQTASGQSELAWELDNQSIPSIGSTPTVSVPGTYVLTVLDPVNGCSNLANVTVVMDTIRPILTNDAPAFLTCIDDEVTLSATVTSTQPYSFEWVGNALADDHTLSPTTTEVGVYQLIVTNQENLCSATLDIEVSSQTQPPSAVITSTGLIDIFHPTVDLSGEYSSSFGGHTYSWSTTDGLILSDNTSAVIEVSEAGHYILFITDTITGCTDEVTYRVLIDDSRGVYIPNAFSPNGDGANDLFTIFGTNIVSVSRLLVYDRWGEELFMQEHFPPNKIGFGWDGNFRNGPMQSGVYVYYAEIEFFDGSIGTYKGDITLIR